MTGERGGGLDPKKMGGLSKNSVCLFTIQYSPYAAKCICAIFIKIIRQGTFSVTISCMLKYMWEKLSI